MSKSSSRGDRDRDSFSCSSDEDDDRENLIHQNDRKPTVHNYNDNDHHHLPASSPPPRRSTFHISDHHDPDDLDRSRFISPGLFLGSSGGGTLNKLKLLLNKRYLMAIFVFLPLLIIVLVYFPTHLSSATFSCALNYKNNNNGLLDANRMRDSELRALYLLRRQQLSLISLLNQTSSSSFYIGPPPANNSNTTTTTTTSTNSNSNSNSSTNYANNNNNYKEYLDNFKSALLKQISLNQEIQQVLLSPHKSKSSTTATGINASFSDDGDSSPTLGTPFQDMCGKLDQRLSDRRTIDWKPRSDKFLFAICLSGQMSNHLICLEKHMFFAALLNRVLVIPSSKFDYQYNRVLDIQHINQCLGRTVVLSFEEFLDANKNKNHPHIDRFFCYFSSPIPCYLDDEHVKRLKGLGMSMGKLESPWKEDVKKPTKRTVQDVEAKFASNHDVIAIGDVFYAQVEKEWVMQPGGPIAHKCKTLIEPSRLIMLTAQRFVQTFLGMNFIALHFRRHGFLKFCNAKEPSCFYPIPQAADCITRIVEKANIPVIYLSTDAADSETGLLQSLVVLNGKTIPLVQRPSHNYAEKWDALLHRHGIADDPQVDAMLDKTICAMSSVFIGASGSTFTEDILRLRKDWGMASLCDEYLCEGELPNFIAEDE